MKRHAALEAVISPTVAGLGYEFVGVEFFAQGKNSTVRVYIDRPGGVNINDCEKVTRQVGAVLDVESGLVRGDYTLEVSSPGLDRKLFSPEQFPRFVGRKLKITLESPLNGQKNFSGVLTAVEGDSINVSLPGDSKIDVNFANIAHANIIDEIARL